ncbi:MAG TPA: enoyl-CoA hydratase-related protein [Myxococcota bacterium]|nr:enoyl-CoA hydratase-related protein [Myxococcota bacterium]
MASIRVERNAGLVTITLDRPEKKNAIGAEAWVELDRALAEVAVEAGDRALIVTGAGGNFSAGADLTGGKPGMGLTGRPLLPMVDEMRVVGEIVLRLARMPKPTLAKVDGVCIGVAIGLALACDLILASDRARFSEIFAKRGLTLDGGNSWLLPRRVGLHKAKELAFFGDVIDAKEAESIGLVNKVVSAGELDAVAEQWGRRLAEGPTLALGLTKRLLDASSSVTLPQALEDEARCQHITYASQDIREGMKAFMERREPRFTGR